MREPRNIFGIIICSPAKFDLSSAPISDGHDAFASTALPRRWVILNIFQSGENAEFICEAEHTKCVAIKMHSGLQSGNRCLNIADRKLAKKKVEAPSGKRKAFN
jgi:hypothetical protein